MRCSCARSAPSTGVHMQPPDRARVPSRAPWLIGVGAGALLAAAALAGDDGACAPAPTACDEPCPGAAMEPAGEAPRAPRCYPANLSEAERKAVIARTGALPPGALRSPTGPRYFVDSTVWLGSGSQGPSGRAQRASLTYSFPADGADWDGQPNILNATLTAPSNFGAGNLDKGRELIRQSLAAWRRVAGLSYSELADDNSPLDGATNRRTTRGDIRIGGNVHGGASFLAYNYYPADGGDMLINAAYFSAGAFMNPVNRFRYFRNTVAHEQGHGLGYAHSTPCIGAKLMEPFITTGIDTLYIDDIRGAERNYGDHYSGNTSAAGAAPLGNLTTPVLRSAIERSLSTNGADGYAGSSDDWFSFSTDTPQNIIITITPTGPTYSNGPQSTGCESNDLRTVTAGRAGDLRAVLVDALTNLPVLLSLGGSAGVVETIQAFPLPPGSYQLHIWDEGPNNPDDQVVQLYDLVVRVGSATARPQAIAGVHKRIGAGQTCFFIGDTCSSATETGATLTAFSWDLDGDGTFEVASAAQPTLTYVSSGVYPVTLRVTDSNGMTSTDTINVTVYGAATAVASVAPSSGLRGQTVPVTISGANLKHVTGASMVTVSGSGVSVAGTPVPNAMGTQVTGLSLVITSGAARGPRNVTVSNADGSGTGVGLFIVGCLADWNRDGAVTPADVAAFINAWSADLTAGTLVSDVNHDGSVSPGDVATFINAWFDALTSGTPC